MYDIIIKCERVLKSIIADVKISAQNSPISLRKYKNTDVSSAMWITKDPQEWQGVCVRDTTALLCDYSIDSVYNSFKCTF